MTQREDNLWARRGHERHAELYDAEYAKQLERIARIRSEISAGLPHRARAPEPPPPATIAQVEAPPREEPSRPASPSQAPSRGAPTVREAPSWDAAPAELAPTSPDDAPRDERPPARPRRRRARGPRAPADPARRARAMKRLAIGAGLGAIAATVAAILVGRPPEAPASTVFRVPGQPTGLVADGGQVWVAGPMSGRVWVLDGTSGREAAPPLRTGGTPARLALDRRFAWVADTERGAVVRMPRAGNGAPRSLRTGPDVADVAITAGAVWTASSSDGTIRVLSERGRWQVLPVGGRPVALAADERRVVAADAAGRLIRLSTRSRRPTGAPIRLGGAPVDVALTGDSAWVADASAGTVRVVALTSGHPGRPIHVGRSPVALAADAGGVYVLCRGDRTLVRLDASTGEVRSTLRLEHSPTALALDSRHVWIAAGDHEVIRVDR